MTSPSALALAILDAIQEPALIVDRGSILAANQGAQEHLGQNIVGRDLRLAIRHPLALDTILAGRPAELELVGIGGADRPWHLNVSPLAGGAILVRLGDRSAVRAAERMRTDFVANASHELRTPLATLIGYAETLAEEGPIDESTRTGFARTIQAEARRMLRIVEDLMSLSRIEADRFRAPDERVDLGEIVRIAVENAAPLAKRGGCGIDVQIAADLPGIAGDFGQLLQLADNLLANAIRYGCAGADARIEVVVRQERSRLILEVRDHGEGIPSDQLPRLTERFYRVDSARSRDSGGTGLGLSIVKHIVERHRGQLEIMSSPGEGTLVRVSLPTD